jgi:hypothetical protein
MSSRSEGGRRGKLSGHKVERKAREFLVREHSNPHLQQALSSGGIRGVGHRHVVAIIGDVHVTSEADPSALSIPKADILLSSVGKADEDALVGISVKKLTRPEVHKHWRSEAQAWDVSIETFFKLLDADGMSFSSAEEHAFRQFAERRALPQDYERVVEFLRCSIEQVTRRTFALGNTRAGPFRATHIWFVPEDCRTDAERFGSVFSIDEICEVAKQTIDRVRWNSGATTVELPWGSVQKTRSSNHNIQFRHDFRRICHLLERS